MTAWEGDGNACLLSSLPTSLQGIRNCQLLDHIILKFGMFFFSPRVARVSTVLYYWPQTAKLFFLNFSSWSVPLYFFPFMYILLIQMAFPAWFLPEKYV